MSDTKYAPIGMLSAAILEQDQEWQDFAGKVSRLEDLDRSHLARLEPFLLKHGEKLRWNWVMMQHRRHGATLPTVVGVDEDGNDILGPERPIFSDNGGNLDAAHDEWMDYEMDRPLSAWLADRPLVKRIRELLGEES